MNSGYSTYEEIDLYLKGKLSGEQLHHFKKRLEVDKEFANTVEHQKIAHKIIFAKELGSLKEKIGQDLKSDPPGNSLFRNIILTSVAVLAVSSAAYYFNSNKIEQKPESINIKDSTSSKEKVIKSTEIETNTSKKNRQNQESKSQPSINSIEKIKADSTITLNIDQTKIEIDKTQETTVDSVKTIEQKKESDKEIPPAVKKTDCTNENITATSDVTSTCKDKAEGIIIINTSQIKGGTPPYSFSLNKENNFSSDHVYSYLKSGNYKIYIRDKNNCKGEIIARIEEKNCESVINEVFNPYYESWKIPVTENTETEIKIYSEAGVLVYSKNIPAGYESEWNGKDLKGEQLANGMYAFIITEKNGSVKKGYISIMY